MHLDLLLVREVRKKKIIQSMVLIFDEKPVRLVTIPPEVTELSK